ncbi:hypothetical protein C7N43_19860 [Sphingobacteriales bacterium UPWRP_1]|nr:hypothetical protein BVG80_02580 [Sphingobacteriales bacterium TSM_CSM]PSJ75243.1 hypothetical protein C7N43_19860 [Sphingobacteriales bacterium UPWRP_1]
MFFSQIQILTIMEFGECAHVAVLTKIGMRVNEYIGQDAARWSKSQSSLKLECGLTLCFANMLIIS